MLNEPLGLVLMLRNSKFQYAPPQETRRFLLLIVLVLVLSTSGTRTRSMHFEYEYEYHFIEYEYDGKPNRATSKGASRDRAFPGKYA